MRSGSGEFYKSMFHAAAKVIESHVFTDDINPLLDRP